MPLGAVLGLASAVAVGFAIYYGGVKLNLRRFFRWTGAFIIFVAAGLLAGALRAFHEAGLWNGLQHTAFDLSALPAAGRSRRHALVRLFGYQDAPTIGEVLVYFAFLIPRFDPVSSAARPRRSRRPPDQPQFSRE